MFKSVKSQYITSKDNTEIVIIETNTLFLLLLWNGFRT